jgi:hypothetical protein
MSVESFDLGRGQLDRMLDYMQQRCGERQGKMGRRSFNGSGTERTAVRIPFGNMVMEQAA